MGYWRLFRFSLCHFPDDRMEPLSSSQDKPERGQGQARRRHPMWGDASAPMAASASMIGANWPAEPARVIQWYVTEGSEVAAGQELAKLDLLETRLAAAQSARRITLGGN